MIRRWLFTASVGLLAIVVACPAALACNESETGATVVSEVYPSADRLPENLLRFYVYFSAPMQRTGGSGAVKLLDADGARIPGVFLPTHRDLWSPDGRRLTLILDPGRVKTGLAAHEALGRALHPGERYTLQVSATAVDASGCPLATSFAKTFTATTADTTSPDLSDWRVTPPASGTRAPINIEMNGPQDHVSLAHRIRVHDAAGVIVAGAIALADHEQTWRFTPRAPWESQDYAIHIDPMLEDIAGNRLGRLFDQPSVLGEPEGEAAQMITLSFTPKTAP